MTVRANYVALGRFFEDLVRRRPDKHATDNILLGRGISMVEVHRGLGEPLTAICTRDVLKASQ